MFHVYFNVGLKHIADLAGYDHILFIIALCAVYRIREWKQILILVTAFTIGHSVTLALSALNIIKVNGDVIEFLIPLTIFATALYNVLYYKRDHSGRLFNFKYLMALFFGLIHGMGFSNYFKGLLGKATNITIPLFAFNVGIEIGQLIIVLFILLGSFIFLDLLKAKHRDWNLFISGGAAGIAITIMMETWPW